MSKNEACILYLRSILEETQEFISKLYNLETDLGINIIDGLSDQLRSMIVGGVFSALRIELRIGQNFIIVTPDEREFILHANVFRDLCEDLEAESINDINSYESLITTILRILIFSVSLNAYLSAIQSVEDNMLSFVNFLNDQKRTKKNLELQKAHTEDIKKSVENLFNKIKLLLSMVHNTTRRSTRNSVPIIDLYPES